MIIILLDIITACPCTRGHGIPTRTCGLCRERATVAREYGVMSTTTENTSPWTLWTTVPVYGRQVPRGKTWTEPIRRGGDRIVNGRTTTSDLTRTGRTRMGSGSVRPSTQGQHSRTSTGVPPNKGWSLFELNNKYW